MGSSQYQMVTWDTLGLLFYFGLPLSIVFFKGWGKYGVSARLVTVGLTGGNVGAYELVAYLALALASLVAVGLPMLNNYSAFGSNWFCKVYTHGQPHTTAVCLSVSLADLLGGEAGGGEETGVFDGEHVQLWDALKRSQGR